MSATFFIQTFTNVFFNFLHVFLRFSTFVFNFHLNVYYIIWLVAVCVVRRVQLSLWFLVAGLSGSELSLFQASSHAA